jgi:hypothetical protein
MPRSRSTWVNHCLHSKSGLRGICKVEISEGLRRELALLAVLASFATCLSFCDISRRFLMARAMQAYMSLPVTRCAVLRIYFSPLGILACCRIIILVDKPEYPESKSW